MTTCETCVYFVTHAEGFGTCRRNPPRPHFGDLSDTAVVTWPVIEADKWCGDHPDMMNELARRAAGIAAEASFDMGLRLRAEGEQRRSEERLTREQTRRIDGAGGPTPNQTIRKKKRKTRNIHKWAREAAISLAWQLLADGDDVTKYDHECPPPPGDHCIRCELEYAGVILQDGTLAPHPCREGSS